MGLIWQFGAFFSIFCILNLDQNKWHQRVVNVIKVNGEMLPRPYFCINLGGYFFPFFMAPCIIYYSEGGIDYKRFYKLTVWYRESRMGALLQSEKFLSTIFSLDYASVLLCIRFPSCILYFLVRQYALKSIYECKIVTHCYRQEATTRSDKTVFFLQTCVTSSRCTSWINRIKCLW